MRVKKMAEIASKKRVLITGTAGFIGFHLAKLLLDEGFVIHGYDGMTNYYDPTLKQRRHQILLQNSNFETTEGMLEDQVLFDHVADEFAPDVIVHLAAQAGVRYSLENPRAYLESNIYGFQRVLEFVHEKKIKQFVYASSSSVYGQNSEQPFSENASCDSPESYYAATKRANELMAKAYSHTFSIPSVGLRFFTVYGPWGRPDMAPFIFADAAYNEKPINVYNYGKQSRDFTYIDDIVQGIYAIVSSYDFKDDAVVCNIGNGAPVDLMDFIGCIEKHTGFEIKKNFVEAQKGDVTSTYANIDKLLNITGYHPQIDINLGVKKFIDWFKIYYGYVH